MISPIFRQQIHWFQTSHLICRPILKSNIIVYVKISQWDIISPRLTPMQINMNYKGEIPIYFLLDSALCLVILMLRTNTKKVCSFNFTNNHSQKYWQWRLHYNCSGAWFMSQLALIFIFKGNLCLCGISYFKSNFVFNPDYASCCISKNSPRIKTKVIALMDISGLETTRVLT